MITCPNCGFQAPDDASECPRCGTGLQQAPQPRRVPNIPRRPQDPLPERPGREPQKFSWIRILLILAVLALFCFKVLPSLIR